MDHLVEKKNPDLGLRQTWFETTPLMIAGELYVRTSYSQLAALDATTGETLWTYDPESYLSGRPAMFGCFRRVGAQGGNFAGTPSNESIVADIQAPTMKTRYPPCG